MRQKNRINFVLALALVIGMLAGSMPVMADDISTEGAEAETAAESTTLKAAAVTEYNLWIANTQVTSENAGDVFNDGTVSFDPTTNTLTLNNATVGYDRDKENKPASVYAKGMDLKILLIGDNEIIGNYPNLENIKDGITVDDAEDNQSGNHCSLTITGGNSESLEITKSHCSIVADGDITLNGGFIYTHSDENRESLGGSVSTYPNAVYSLYGNITLDEGSLKIKTVGKGLFTDEGNVYFNNGKVTINSKNESIEAEKAVEITGGELLLEAAKEEAIDADGVTISGGTLTAFSDSNDGIYGRGSITISGGTVKATGAKSDSNGLFSDNTITITEDVQRVEATARKSSSPGILSYEGLTVGGKITEPANGVIKTYEEGDKTKYTVGTLSGDNFTPAKLVVIENNSTPPSPDPSVTPSPDPSVTPVPGSDPNQKGTDGTAVGPGASAACADKAITSMNSDNDPAGSMFAPLKLKSAKQGKSNIKLVWTKANGAASFVVYGNIAGAKNKMKKLTTVKTNKYTVKKISKKLKKGTYHKFIVVALDSNNNVVSTSKVIHVATSGGKAGNHKSVTVTKKVANKAKKLRMGKTLKLKAKAVAKSKKLKVKKYKAVRYESSNTKIATVNNKGIVKGKAKGTCYINVYAQNGVYKKLKVTVN